MGYGGFDSKRAKGGGRQRTPSGCCPESQNEIGNREMIASGFRTAIWMWVFAGRQGNPVGAQNGCGDALGASVKTRNELRAGCRHRLQRDHGHLSGAAPPQTDRCEIRLCAGPRRATLPYVFRQSVKSLVADDFHGRFPANRSRNCHRAHGTSYLLGEWSILASCRQNARESPTTPRTCQGEIAIWICRRAACGCAFNDESKRVSVDLTASPRA